MSDWVIEASKLTRRFGDLTAVDSLDLQVERGNIYGFLGPNGSGKTTAIRMLTGLLRPSAGEVSVLGTQLPQGAEKLRLQIGYMTQKFSLYEDLSVDENLEFIARIYGFSRKARQQRVAEQLRIYDLQDQHTQLAGGMSGGQRQRLALAAATLHRPQLLFLDEPTSAVDPQSRRDFWEQLFDLAEAGTTILVSSHYMDEAERCHRLAILDHGCKRADDTPEALMNNLGASIIEIEARELRQLKVQLLELPEVFSAAQQGSRLRVQVDAKVSDPLDFIRQQDCLQQLQQAQPDLELEVVRPSLEDVFVAATQGGRK